MSGIKKALLKVELFNNGDKLSYIYKIFSDMKDELKMD